MVTGDFLQLQPCNREDTIYYNEGSLLWEQSLTTLVELDGQHRFSECPDYQAIMPALRSGNITNEIRNKLNTRVVDGINVKLPTAHDCKYASYHNYVRSSINAQVFRRYLKTHLITRMRPKILFPWALL